MLSALARPACTVSRSHGGSAAERVILVDRTPGADLLSEQRGQPVWPLSDEEDWAFVSQVCAQRSITIRDVASQPAVVEPALPRGGVTGVGDTAVTELARLYAHLTRRAYIPGGRADLPGDSVVVTTFGALTSELLASIYTERKSGPAPGLICAADTAQLRRQVLVRAIFAAWPEIDADLPWTAVFPTAAIGTQERHDLRVLGSASPTAEIREAITARSGLLAIATHSDGIDAMLSPALALCGISAEHLKAPLDREPACLASNHCHRFDVPVIEVSGLGGVVAPADISAGLMVFDTCFGTLAADAPINNHRGLGRQLVENAEIGALVTTWELTLLDPGKLDSFLGDLRTGMNLGHAVARFNRSPAARRHAARLALFGDPRMRFAPRTAVPAGADRGSIPVTARSPEKPGMTQELGFSRACLERGMADLHSQLASCGPKVEAQIAQQLAAASRALELLRKYCSGAVDPGDEQALRQALVEDAFIRRPLDDWKEFADGTDWDHCRCASCGAPSWVGVIGVQVPEVSRRRVVLCPNCNLSEDMPEHVRINLRFDAASRMCQLEGDPPARDWSAALILRTRDPARDRLWNWPEAPDGTPSKQMLMPEPLPPGPVRVAVILAHGGWLAWTAMDVHGGPAQ